MLGVAGGQGAARTSLPDSGRPTWGCCHWCQENPGWWCLWAEVAPAVPGSHPRLTVKDVWKAVRLKRLSHWFRFSWASLH